MHRIILEASLYKENAFVTLTYDEAHLPENGSLVPRDPQLFLKKLRKAYEPHKLRYFLVGEYGDETHRPHYHLALFGYPTCQKGITSYRRGSCCTVCDGVRAAWSSNGAALGNIYLGGLTAESAGYVAGYVTKKLTKKDDDRLNGRHPEFARMSLRPGIGADMMDEVASVLLQYPTEELEDVPGVLRHGSRLLPLGRYLKGRLRERIGRPKNAPQIVLEKQKEELRPLHEIAYATAPTGSKAFLFKSMVIDAGEGQRIRTEAKHKNRRKKHL